MINSSYEKQKLIRKVVIRSECNTKMLFNTLFFLFLNTDFPRAKVLLSPELRGFDISIWPRELKFFILYFRKLPGQRLLLQK